MIVYCKCCLTGFSGFLSFSAFLTLESIYTCYENIMKILKFTTKKPHDPQQWSRTF